MKKTVSLCVVCLCMIALLLPCAALAVENADPYTESTHGTGPSALLSVSDDGVRAEIEEYLAENDLRVISISTKSIYLKTEMLADGTVNRVPMTEAEVNAYKASVNHEVAPLFIDNPEPKENGKLTITLIVSADARYQVRIDTRATWEKSTLFGDNKYQPSGEDDTYTVTWGKTDYLVARSGSCAVEYRDGQTAVPRKNLGGEQGTYSWSFAERTSSGVDAKKIYSTIVLAPHTTYQGGTTWCEFTYVHTYLKNNGSTATRLKWPLSVSADGLPY